VSRPWSDDYGFYLSPRRIVTARMRKGLRRRCEFESEVFVGAGRGGDWLPACDALTGVLGERDWRGAGVHVIVADHWARYAILPWSAELTGDAERLAHAKALLDSVYGSSGGDWTIRLGSTRPQLPALISALPEELLHRVESALSARNLRPVSLQTNLVASFNRWRGRLGDGTSWFAAVDEGILAALHLTQGRIDRVQSVRVGGDWTTELKRIRTLGRLTMRGIDGGRVYVDAPESVRAACRSQPGDFVWLNDSDDRGAATGSVFVMTGTRA